jgi:PKD repeat protein
MNAPSLCLRLAALAATVLLLAPSPAFAGPDKGSGHRSFPKLRLKSPHRGRDAVDQLSTRLPEVARAYGLNSAELRRMLLADPTLNVDVEGRLHYAEPLPKAAGTVMGAPEAAAVSPEQVFLLHSRPGAKRTIYLDFDGHLLSGVAWNTSYNAGADILAPAFDLDGDPTSFSDAERAVVQEVWQRVAEDFAPFDVDVTTEPGGEDRLTRSLWSDDVFGTRILISPISQYFGSYGGLAYVGTFDDIGDTYKTALIFPDRLSGNPKYIAEAAAHECGHSLGLNHDGVTAGSSYYSGHGAGETSWAPLMGAGYYANLTQWSKGEYAAADNPQDDLAVMRTYGLPARADDHGNVATTATMMPAGEVWTAAGVIGSETDVDVFSFTTAGGDLAVSLTPAGIGPNLDLAAELRDGADNVLQTVNPQGVIGANISLPLAAGTYYLHVRGAGQGDPLLGGYSAYGSVGQYSIAGSVGGGNPEIFIESRAPVAVATLTPTAGIAGVTQFTFDASASFDSDGSVVAYAWDFGDGTGGNGALVAKIYAQPGQYAVTVTVTDESGLTHSAGGTVEVAAPNLPPVAVALASLSEGVAPVTVTLDGSGSSDPDGRIISHAWSLGDGTTATGPVVSKTYSVAGTYTAVLTVTDDRGATATRATTIVVSPAVKQLRVQSISLVQQASGTRALIQSTVQITDTLGNPVSGAKVSFRWSGTVSGSGSATTDSAGRIVVPSKTFTSAGSVTFAVTGLSKTGFTYNVANNLMTSVTFYASRLPRTR